MTLADDETTGQPQIARADDLPDDSTGLPWPRAWPGVYLFVLGCFVTWVTLLVVLERVFP
jgi:hypothetical protein